MTGPRPSTQAIADAAVWAVLNKAGEKHFVRELLKPGVHQVSLQVIGDVDGQLVNKKLTSTLTINPDTTRNKSQEPMPAHVLALALADMPKKAREAFLEDLPGLFAAKGELKPENQLPAADPMLLARCGKLLERLRATTTQEVRGNVSAATVVTETET